MLSFHQLFASKKDRISPSRKVQNKNFSVISKYHVSISFFVSWLEKDRIFHPWNIQNKGFLGTNKRYPMLKKISYRFFTFFEGWIKLSHFLKHCASFFFVPTSCVEKNLLLPPEIRNINFSFIQKFINSSFLPNTNFHGNVFLLTILKGLKPF